MGQKLARAVVRGIDIAPTATEWLPRLDSPTLSNYEQTRGGQKCANTLEEDPSVLLGVSPLKAGLSESSFTTHRRPGFPFIRPSF
jgi:hypothetical protein